MFSHLLVNVSFPRSAICTAVVNKLPVFVGRAQLYLGTLCPHSDQHCSWVSLAFLHSQLFLDYCHQRAILLAHLLYLSFTAVMHCCRLIGLKHVDFSCYSHGGKASQL